MGSQPLSVIPHTAKDVSASILLLPTFQLFDIERFQFIFVFQRNMLVQSTSKVLIGLSFHIPTRFEAESTNKVFQFTVKLSCIVVVPLILKLL